MDIANLIVVVVVVVVVVRHCYYCCCYCIVVFKKYTYQEQICSFEFVVVALFFSYNRDLTIRFFGLSEGIARVGETFPIWILSLLCKFHF